jgi:carboxyl-terminal processing protease
VGPSKSTYGKGTVQNMFDFDRAVPASLNQLKPLGAIKITTEKFYRISGGTTQLQGVTPDISLPGAYDGIEIGEKEYENALAIDFVEKANYMPLTQWEKQFAKAKKSAQKRVAGNPSFAKYEEYADWIAEGDKDKWIPLNYTNYLAFQDSIKAASEAYKNLSKLNDSLGIVPLDHHPTAATDSAQAEIYQKWYKGLSKDLVLREANTIVSELAK